MAPSMAQITTIWFATTLMLLLTTLQFSAGAAADEPSAGRATIGMPNCSTSCGGVAVPYPFGMDSPRCYWLGFNLTCDRSRHPPRLLIGYGGALRVVEISLRNTTVRVNRTGAVINTTAVANAAVHERNVTFGSSFASGGRVDGRATTTYTLSTRNELILTGCNAQAMLLGDGNTNVISGCASFCPGGANSSRAKGPVGTGHDKYCSGMGCCQASISLGSTPSDVQFRWLNGDHAQDLRPLPVLVFVAERGWFDQPWVTDELVKKSRPAAAMEVPVVLQWEAVEGLAAADASSYPNCSGEVARKLCKSDNSQCKQGNRGYSCQCIDGYDGNPYIPHGCKDINECKRPQEEIGCFGECTNTLGSFYCECPQGTHGNHALPGGCQRSITGISIAIGTASAAGLLLLVLMAFFISYKVKHRRAQKLKQKFFEQNRGQLLQQLVSQRADIAERMIISLEELEKATNNFDKSRELGGGGHGTVYKGMLSDLHVVAIKKPNMMVQSEIDDFINEVAILSQVNHINVVKLYGCCLETEVPMLVYEFISNGTLHNHLHGGETRPPLSWNNRLRIAVETARALAHLHSTVSTPIIHRDVKSTNILLDDTLTAKVADFGASRYVPMDKSGVTTMVQGTIGYLDPMYFYTWRLTEKSDVFSFGVILVELLTRKKPSSYMSSKGDGLVAHFVTLFAEDSLSQILDPQIMDEGGKQVEEAAALAVACIKLRREERPTMRQVELALEGLQTSEEPVLNDVLVERFEKHQSALSYAYSKGESSMEDLSHVYSWEEDLSM